LFSLAVPTGSNPPVFAAGIAVEGIDDLLELAGVVA
jgi:hypothetical protein